MSIIDDLFEPPTSYLALIAFACFLFLFLGIYSDAVERNISLEIKELVSLTLPRGEKILKIKFENLKTEDMRRATFLLVNEDQEVQIKKGGRYIFTYDSLLGESFRGIGIDYRLLKIEDLK